MSQYYEGVGRRKTSTARVRLSSGEGTITCNERPGPDYFPRPGDMDLVLLPLATAGLAGKYNITIQVKGGGITGQVGASQLGVSPALPKIDAALRRQFRKANLLTRDPREKERKKPGLKPARKAPTYTNP